MFLARRQVTCYLAVARRERRFFVSTSPSKQHKPPRILFCGSDAFSIYSLRALQELKQAQPSKIEDIAVVCRSDKRVGRGLRQTQSVPIKAVSEELGLTLYQLDTFKEWTPPTIKPDLIVTASFGLLVPAAVLSYARYGGINVHPSLLPDFRGAAPIQHAIMQRVNFTGVSVQTMHPTKFDHGLVLAQQQVEMQAPGEAPVTTLRLIEKLGPIGGNLLVKTIQDGLFLEPSSDFHHVSHAEPTHKAPKITQSNRHIDWSEWTAKDIIAYDNALGSLWDRTTFARCCGPGQRSEKRIVFTGPWSIKKSLTGQVEAGQPLVLSSVSDGGSAFAITTVDGHAVSPAAATIEGDGKNKGLKTLKRLLSSRSVGP